MKRLISAYEAVDEHQDQGYGTQYFHWSGIDSWLPNHCDRFCKYGQVADLS
jgi:hypothetical protein